jgi:hypothetical protein
MSYKKFSIFILCVLYVCLASLALINFVVDPYGIFQTPFFKNQPNLNERYSKIEFLRKHKEGYNSYIMGSSRANTSSDIVEKYLPGAKFYNLAITLAVPYEHILHLKYFIKNGYPVRNLYIDLDIDLCFAGKMHKDKDLLCRLHPGVLNQSLISYYWSYLSVFPKTDIRRKLKLNFRKKRSPIQISEKDGAWILEEGSENAKVFFDNPADHETTTIKNEVKEENLEVLRELVALCGQHEINLILFITPHSKFIMSRLAVEDYLTFLRKLSGITSFWNFSGYNSITINNRNYSDPSHHKSSVSRMIAARIFNDKTSTVPEDFGVLVTKENIDSHLENLKIAIKKFRAS